MPSLATTSAEALALVQAKHLARTLPVTERCDGPVVVRAGVECISFASNDYFGMARHPRVIAAMQAATAQHGAGAGASRLAGGNHAAYAALESRLAALKNKEAACVYGSGYLANLGVISALVGAGDLILADKFIHACMIDGARLSGATLMRFAHNNTEHCSALLSDNRKDFARCIILTESIFSMDGDAAPLGVLRELADAHDAWLLVDDAHGFGFMPGAQHADIIIGTLSKGLGAYGGYVCADAATIALLASQSRSLLFSTALPPSIVAAAGEALQVLESEPWRMQMPLKNAAHFAAPSEVGSATKCHHAAGAGGGRTRP